DQDHRQDAVDGLRRVQRRKLRRRAEADVGVGEAADLLDHVDEVEKDEETREDREDGLGEAAGDIEGERHEATAATRPWCTRRARPASASRTAAIPSPAATGR